MPGDLLIKNALIVSGSDFKNYDQKHDILVKDGIIVSIETSIENPNKYKEIDAKNMLVMPGFVNAHIHTWQTGLRGLAGDWTATNYLEQCMLA